MTRLKAVACFYGKTQENKGTIVEEFTGIGEGQQLDIRTGMTQYEGQPLPVKQDL